jgi:NitT/TauT family transport system permease protein
MPRLFNRRAAAIRFWQILLLGLMVAIWQLASKDINIAFFFGTPAGVAAVFWQWFVVQRDIYNQLGITLLETIIGFAIGTVSGLAVGLWLGLSRGASALLDPYITAANSMPRVILAPIFCMWFGLGIWSKVALAVTLVFFVVFFNVYQGVREVSATLLDNSRMLGANRRQLLWYVYIPSATSWVFSSLHTSVGMAFLGAVVGEYLGSASGVGYLILQAEGTLDMNTVFAGILLLTMFAIILDGFVTRLEKKLLVWKPKVGRTGKTAEGRRSAPRKVVGIGT